MYSYIYFFVRIVFLFANYNIGHDLSVQMQQSGNINNGLGFITAFAAEQGDITFRSYWGFPPFLAYLLAFFNLFTKNVLFSDLIIRILLVLSETLLFKKITSFFEWTDQRHKTLFLAGALVVLSHYFNSFTGDLIAFNWFLCLLVCTWNFLKSEQPLQLILICLLIVLVPSIKYSFFPMVTLPLLICLLGGRRKIRELLQWKPAYLMAFAVLVSGLLFVYLTGKEMSGNVHGIRLDNIQYLSRIDHFWLKFGDPGDRIYKMLARRIELYAHYPVLPRTIGLIFSLIVLLYVVRLHLISANRRIHSFLLAILIASFLQISFLLFLTLSSDPQIGDYGIDKKIWVPIEESRYFLHLKYLCLLYLIYFLSAKGKKLLTAGITGMLLISFLLHIKEQKTGHFGTFLAIQKSIQNKGDLTSYDPKLVRSMKTVYLPLLAEKK